MFPIILVFDLKESVNHSVSCFSGRNMNSRIVSLWFLNFNLFISKNWVRTK